MKISALKFTIVATLFALSQANPIVTGGVAICDIVPEYVSFTLMRIRLPY